MHVKDSNLQTPAQLDTLTRLAQVIEHRKPDQGGNPESSYVARLLHQGPDFFLKKVGEEAAEVVMAGKDLQHGGDAVKFVHEVADLWFHCMVALAYFGLSPQDVLRELEQREGTSGLEEKALRKAIVREGER
jgi:phosphoribosyl-ATP pyrophosphohydrolase